MPRRIALTRGSLLAATLAMALTAGADERVLWLREEGAVAEVPAGAIAPGEVAPEAPSADVEAPTRAALAEARRLYLAYSFAEAAAALQAAGARDGAALLRGHRALAVELALWTGACAQLAEDAEGSRGAFRRALALSPEARLPAGVFPPAVEQSFEELRRAAVLAGDGARTIRSIPAGARIEVDGRAEGVTPVTVRLPAGIHHLRLERTGYRTWSGPLPIEGGAVNEGEVVLAEVRGTELRAQLRRREGLWEVPDAATLEGIRREYGVGRVVVVRRDGTTLRHPASASSVGPWPWIVGSAVVAVGVGVGLYFALRPEPGFNIVAP